MARRSGGVDRPYRRWLAATGGVIAALVLVGWWTGVGLLVDAGLPAATTPWSAVGLVLVALASVLHGTVRRVLLATATVIAGTALVAPETALSLQELVVPGVGAVSSPGTATVTLLAVGAAGLRERAPETSFGLLLAAVSLAMTSVAAVFVGWSWVVAAGSGSVATGLAVPTATLLVIAAVVIVTEPSDTLGESAVPWTRRLVWPAVTGLATPWVVMGLLGPTDQARYLASAMGTALVVVVVTRAADLSGVGEGIGAVEVLLHGAPDAMVLVDSDGTIVRANQMMEALAGWDPGVIEGTSIDALVPTGRREQHRQLRENFVRTGGTRRMGEGSEVSLVRADGSTIPVEVALAPLHVAGRELVAATVRDASSHRDAMDSLLRLEAMRSLFLSAVSHELRTPLTVVKGLADTLIAHGDELDDQMREQITARLGGAADRLDQLLDDLLNLQRLERGDGLEPTLVAAADVGRMAVEAARQEGVDEFTLQLRDDMRDAMVQTDPVLLSRALHNLLSNAVKYAPGPVEMSMVHRGGGLELRVEDHGPGVPEHLRDAVFEPFGRGQQTDGAAPGVGIGLSLVAGLATVCNGRAWATSRADGDQGASFRMWLPELSSADRRGGPEDRRRRVAEPPPMVGHDRRRGPDDRRGSGR